MTRIFSSVRSVRRISALSIALVSFAVLLAASMVRADSITYSILPNPQPDTTSNGGTDNLSGTITFSSLSPITGTYTSANDAGVNVTSDLTITNSNVGPVTYIGTQTLATDLNGGDITLTSAGLVLDASSQFAIYDFGSPVTPSVSADWDLPDNIYEGSADLVTYFGNTAAFQNVDARQYLVDGNWTIAAAVVPEPGTLALLVSGIVGLGLIGRRRCSTGRH